MPIQIYLSKDSLKYRIRKDGEIYPEEFETKEDAKLIASLLYPGIARLVMK